MAYKTVIKALFNNRTLYRAIRPAASLALTSARNVRLRPCLPPGRLASKVALGLSLLAWLGFEDQDQDEESELILTLKRAVLCTKREQFDKAEQMLHLALRLAQQQQNQQGVLYCYDLMANLALDRFELEKAEKLFVSVLQMLLGNGTAQDDLKVIHISAKLARISQLQADYDRASLGFNWCLEQIEKHRSTGANLDAQMLYGVIQDWYAQHLLDKGEVEKSMKHLLEAYKVCKMTVGQETEQCMLLLNDLGTTCFRAGDLETSTRYFKEAITIGGKVEDKTHLGVVHANLGLILLAQGMQKDAEQSCKEAWNLGKKLDNTESIEQANYCLDQIKLLFG